MTIPNSALPLGPQHNSSPLQSLGPQLTTAIQLFQFHALLQTPSATPTHQVSMSPCPVAGVYVTMCDPHTPGVYVTMPCERAVCYKREYTFESNEDVQYEERSCVQDKSYIEDMCDENDEQEELKKCKVYTCEENRCERAVCYKREYTFESNEDVQYEERSCVQDKSYIEDMCDENDEQEELKKCKVYTCEENRCNSGVTVSVTVSLLVAMVAGRFL
eukprot:sb/3469946/